jgi:peptide/nickel transport system permease protein
VALFLYMARRLFYAAILVIGVLVLSFLLIRLAPGDPVDTLAGQMGGMTEEIRASLRSEYGLDKPTLAQLGIYLERFASGNLGYSYFFNLPVLSLILQRLPATLLLVLTALIVETVVLALRLGLLNFTQLEMSHQSSRQP